MSKWRKRYKGKTTSWIRNQLVRQHGCVCGICGDDIVRLKYATLDHIIPKSRGGSDDITNLQLAHEWCNNDKDDMLPEEYAEWQLQTKS